MQAITLVTGINKKPVKKELLNLTVGTFFMFDLKGDVLCRMTEIKNDRVFFYHAISENNVGSFNDDGSSMVYLVDSIPDSFSEILKKEFRDAMIKRITAHLNTWEIALLRSSFCGAPVNFEDLKSQQQDNVQLMKEMIGVDAANILSNI